MARYCTCSNLAYLHLFLYTENIANQSPSLSFSTNAGDRREVPQYTRASGRHAWGGVRSVGPAALHPPRRLQFTVGVTFVICSPLVIYRDGKKEMQILLSNRANSCLVLPALVKQQHEDLSSNHVPSLFAVSVQVVAGSLTAGLG